MRRRSNYCERSINIRSVRLSNVGCGQCADGWPLEKPLCRVKNTKNRDYHYLMEITNAKIKPASMLCPLLL
jgi:hypothetical protein